MMVDILQSEDVDNMFKVILQIACVSWESSTHEEYV
jgi:hypothetical protein